jgi:hypothetical protein
MRSILTPAHQTALASGKILPELILASRFLIHVRTRIALWWRHAGLGANRGYERERQNGGK